MIPVELGPAVAASLKSMRDRGEQPPRCRDGVIRSAIATAVRRLVEGGLGGGVRAFKNEIFDGATPYSTYLRGVIIDGDGGVLLSGREGSADVIEG